MHLAVAIVTDTSTDSKKGSKGTILHTNISPKQKTAAMKFFAKSFQDLSERLKETSVHRLKNLYQEYLKVMGDVPSKKVYWKKWLSTDGRK